tara:strand:- start:18959 stop:19063 length:105 start_codon:yes stop_codon:yes gene_type:complete
LAEGDMMKNLKETKTISLPLCFLLLAGALMSSGA